MEEILSSWKALILAILAMSGISMKIVKGLIELNDETLRRRRSKYLQFVRDEAGADEAICGLIDALRAEEAFRRIFGRYASPRLAHAIKRLFDTKRFSIREIREAAQYFRIDESGELRSSSGKVGLFVKWVGGSFVVANALFTFTMIYPLILNPDTKNVAAVAILLIMFVFASWYFGRDVRQAIAADRLDATIRKLQEV
ncbi:hypothetical protein D3C81_750200 [compost metagenome]